MKKVTFKNRKMQPPPVKILNFYFCNYLVMDHEEFILHCWAWTTLGVALF